MRCTCGAPLTQWDMARKSPSTGENMYICTPCWKAVKEVIYYQDFVNVFEMPTEKTEHDVCKDQTTLPEVQQQ